VGGFGLTAVHGGEVAGMLKCSKARRSMTECYGLGLWEMSYGYFDFHAEKVGRGFKERM